MTVGMTTPATLDAPKASGASNDDLGQERQSANE
jgi:hypothetical protein